MRDFAVKSAEEGELDDEAEWIYRRAFLEMPISQQQVKNTNNLTLNLSNVPFYQKYIFIVLKKIIIYNCHLSSLIILYHGEC